MIPILPGMQYYYETKNMIVEIIDFKAFYKVLMLHKYSNIIY